MEIPVTLDEVYRMFPNEQRYWRALRCMRWPEGFRCPRCGHGKSHRLSQRALQQCAGRRYQAS